MKGIHISNLRFHISTGSESDGVSNLLRVKATEIMNLINIHHTKGDITFPELYPVIRVRFMDKT